MSIRAGARLITAFATAALINLRCADEIGGERTALKPGKVALCHYDGERYLPKQIPSSAVSGHLSHGDHLVSEDDAGACGAQCVACGTAELCEGGSCRPACTPSCPEGVGCGSAPDGCGGQIFCGSCPGGQVCDRGSCQACGPTPDTMDGRYEGAASLDLRWADGWDWPFCSEHERSVSTRAVLTVTSSPTFDVDLAFPDHVGYPNEIIFDLEPVDPNVWQTDAPWQVAADGRSADLPWEFCLNDFGVYAEWGYANIAMAPGPGGLSVNAECEAGHLDACSLPNNRRTAYSMWLERVCLPDQTACIDDSVVTCDAAGNVVSSVSCGASCGSPCAACACAPCAADELCFQGACCRPTTCAAEGKNCGAFSDGCGGTIDCGTCTSPETCGAETPNVCGICTPMTSCPPDVTCGTIADGCGGTIDCGTCGAGEVCLQGSCQTCTSTSIDGHYEGTAEIYTFYRAGRWLSSCWGEEWTTSAFTTIDVQTTPFVEVSLAMPGYIPNPYELSIDLDPYDGDCGECQLWQRSGETLSAIDTLCTEYPYWTSGSATLALDPITGSLNVDVRCTRSWDPACDFDHVTSYSMVLPRVCR